MGSLTFVKPNYNLLNCLVFQKIAFLHFGVKIQDGCLDFRGSIMGFIEKPRYDIGGQ